MIKLVFINDSKERVMKLAKDLVEGHYDEVMNESHLLISMASDKQKMCVKVNDGLTIEEAFNEVFIENIETLRNQFGGNEALTVEAYNDGVEMVNQEDEMIEAIAEVMTEKEAEVFKESYYIARNLRLEVVEG